MLAYLFICLGACMVHSENLNIVRHSNTDGLKGSYVDPNAWPKEYFEGKTQSMETPFGVALLKIKQKSYSTRTSMEKTVPDYLTVRRFINLLLKRAHFEDLEGNDVPLESISSSKDRSLVMSLQVFASQEELNTLRKFGQRTPDLSARQIDEVITNIFSSETPSGHMNKCRHSLWAWVDGIRNTLDDISQRVDFISVLYFAVVLYIIWSINVIIRRRGDWKMLFMCFLLPSIAWEFSRVYQEETIRQLSEQMRLGEIPNHCNGVDERSFLERLMSRKSDVECYEHHLRKLGHPVLKVSIFKVLLSQVQLILDLVVNFIKDVTASNPNDWFLTRMLNKVVYTSFLAVVIIAIAAILIVIKFGGAISMPFFFSIKNIPQPVYSGSKVQQISPEEEEQIRPPPRRRGRLRSGATDEIDGRPIQKIVYNITSQNVHLNGRVTPSAGTQALCKNEECNDSDSGREKQKGILSILDREKELVHEVEAEVQGKRHKSEESSDKAGVYETRDEINCEKHKSEGISDESGSEGSSSDSVKGVSVASIDAP